MECENDTACDTDAGQECCTAEQCQDTCMVPCDNADECPVDGMGCEHGYCLFPCSEDADCLDWPDYTCQHDDTYCELD